MKKTVLLFAVVGMLSLHSCVIVRTHQITDNPIGTKVGMSKGRNLLTGDAGIAAAAKNGKITQIGSVDYKVRALGTVIVVVTGE